MYSQRSFIPGNNKSTSRIIKYIAEFNRLYPEKNINTCYCVPNKYDKNTPSSVSSSYKISNYQRISQIINNSKGGNIQFGNFYLGQPLNINYLGRIEGMPGGSGSPPINKF